MSQNTPTLQKICISLAVLFLVGYGLFTSRFLLQGPEIVLANTNPDSQANTIIHADTRDFSLQGNVQHSSLITINNRPILVDEQGNFNEKLLLSNGVSIIDIYARDRFGKEARKKVDVVYAENSPSPTIEYSKIALNAQKSSSSTTDTIKKSSSDSASTSASTTNQTSSTDTGAATSSRF
jgi:hypothetical protein